jgi:hypothetical protein
MAERRFLATYRPLVKSRAGREAIRQHALLPFIDGSCRREPDFESRFPSIAAICRAGTFAPRLLVGDRIAYLTVKGKYVGAREFGWRLVAPPMQSLAKRAPTGNTILPQSIIVCIIFHSWSTCEELKWRLSIDL